MFSEIKGKATSSWKRPIELVKSIEGVFAPVSNQ